MIICAPVVSQMAVEGAVRQAWDYPLSFHGELQRRRDLLAAGLRAMPGVSWTPADGGFFAFARIDGCADSAALAARLLEEAHVVTIPGSAFGRSGEGCLRLSYGSAPSEALAEAIQRLGAYFDRQAAATA